jgi:hypothetical protein
MDDSFGGTSGLRYRRRFKAKEERGSFSPSYGVRHGIVPNPNWPPPPNVEVATDRRASPRVPLTFHLRLGAERLKVDGDISAGGAGFQLNQPLELNQVELFVTFPSDNRERRLVADILRVQVIDGAVFHHARWHDPTEVAAPMAGWLQARRAQALMAISS